MKSHSMLIVAAAVLVAGCSSPTSTGGNTQPEMNPEDTSNLNNNTNATVVTHTSSGFSP